MIYIIFLCITLFILLVVFYQCQYFMIFSPTYIKERSLCEKCELLSIESDDGVTLEGVVYEPLNAVDTLLVFVGRSHDAVALINKLAQTYPNVRIVTFNYRGYGKSEGSVNEKNILSDGLKIAQLVEKHYGDFYLLGFSLGANIAALIAKEMRVKGVFLIGAFDSIGSLSKEKYSKLCCIEKMIRYKFPTVEYVKKVDATTYLFASRDDETVYIKNTRNLMEAIKNLAEYVELDGLTHKELLWDKRVTDKINRIIDEKHNI